MRGSVRVPQRQKPPQSFQFTHAPFHQQVEQTEVTAEVHRFRFLLSGGAARKILLGSAVAAGQIPGHGVMSIDIPVTRLACRLLHGDILLLHPPSMFLHEVPHTQCGAHEVQGFQPLLEFIHVNVGPFTSCQHRHLLAVVRYRKRISAAEVRHDVSSQVLEPASLEVFDALDAAQFPIQFPLGVSLLWDCHPHILYRTVIPGVKAVTFLRTARNVHLQPDRTGKILHCRPVNPYQYLRGIITGKNLQFGGKGQFLRMQHLDPADMLAEVTVAVQETPYPFDNPILVIEIRGEPEREVIGALVRVCRDRHVLYHRETGKDELAVIICRHRGRGIDLGSGKQPVPSHLPCPVRVREVVLQGEAQFVIRLGQGIVHRIGHGHAGITRVIVAPHLSRKTLKFIERPALKKGIKVVPLGSCYV